PWRASRRARSRVCFSGIKAPLSAAAGVLASDGSRGHSGWVRFIFVGGTLLAALDHRGIGFGFNLLLRSLLLLWLIFARSSDELGFGFEPMLLIVAGLVPALLKESVSVPSDFFVGGFVI